MVFPPEREAAYVQRMFGWQGTRLRRLVLFAPLFFLFFIGIQALLMPAAPDRMAARAPDLGRVVVLAAIGLWMRTVRERRPASPGRAWRCRPCSSCSAP